VGLVEGVKVCIQLEIIAFFYQVFVCWLLIDNYLEKVWVETDIGPAESNALGIDVLPIVLNFIWLARLVGAGLWISGFVYLAISPFIRETSVSEG